MPDDIARADEGGFGGLDDLFDEPAATAADAAPAEQAAFLDAATIDEELLSSVEDVLSELDGLEQSDEDLFGLHSELGAPKRPAGAQAAPAPDGPFFPDIFPVEELAAPPRRVEHAAPAPAPAWTPAPAQTARHAWLPTVSVLIANSALLLFAWSASRSLQASLKDVRAELDDVRSTALVGRTDPDARRDASGSRAVPVATLALDAARDAEPALPTFDQLALEVAEREMQNGLYASARRRLHGLLALADRIEPERRDDVEARTSFLVADSYRREAEERREVTQ